MLGGPSHQNLEKDFAFWSNFDLDFILLRLPFDFFFSPQNRDYLLKTKDKYKTNLLFHPRSPGQTFLTPADPKNHPLILESLDLITELILQHNFIPKIILHPGEYQILNKNYPSYTETDALKNCPPFYSKLKEKINPQIQIVLENLHAPPYGSWKQLGYQPQHFLQVCGLGYEFCLDTGHLKLSSHSLEEFLELPYPLTCFHLHSNNGLHDQHLLPTKQNLPQAEKIEKLLSPDKYIALEVKNPSLQELSLTLNYLRKNKFPPS